MTTAALRLARERTIASEPERLSYGAVELEVTDVHRSADFWTSVLGFTASQDGNAMILSAGGDPLFVLHPGAVRAAQPRHAGMYHVAIGVTSQAEFSRHLARFFSRNIPAAPVDHLMSKAIYLQDPDNLGIEIAFETPERFGRFGDLTRDFSLFDKDGNFHSGRERLNLAAEFEHARGLDLNAPMEPGAHVAHLHLHVPELRPAIGFYERLGFAGNLLLPQMGFADLGAGGPYTHRLALNVWQGPGVPPTPKGTARLRSFTLQAAEMEIYAAAKALPDAEDSAGGLVFTDTAGVSVKMLAPR